MLCPIKSCKENGCNCFKDHTIFLGFFVLAILIWLFKLNQPLFYIINSWHGFIPVSVWSALNFVSYSKTFILPILLIAITFVWRRDRLKRVIVLIITYYILFSLLKILVGEARPYVTLPIDSFYWLNQSENAASSAYKSFPSGHTGNIAIFVFALSSFTSSKWAKLSLFLLLAIVGLARICTGWHWPLDVIASGLIGYLLVQICFCSKK